MSVVWIRMLGGDTENAASRSAEEILAHPSVRHFYDPLKRSGKAVARSLGGQEGDVAWDVYLAYEKGSRWGKSPPTPTEWLHQCTGYGWADPARYHTGDDLVRELQEVVTRVTSLEA